jgi:hypothetical protein
VPADHGSRIAASALANPQRYLTIQAAAGRYHKTSAGDCRKQANAGAENVAELYGTLRFCQLNIGQKREHEHHPTGTRNGAGWKPQKHLR